MSKENKTPLQEKRREIRTTKMYLETLESIASALRHDLSSECSTKRERSAKLERSLKPWEVNGNGNRTVTEKSAKPEKTPNPWEIDVDQSSETYNNYYKDECDAVDSLNFTGRSSNTARGALSSMKKKTNKVITKVKKNEIDGTVTHMAVVKERGKKLIFAIAAAYLLVMMSYMIPRAHAFDGKDEGRIIYYTTPASF